MEEPSEQEGKTSSRLERIVRYTTEFAQDLPKFTNDLISAGPNEIKGAIGNVWNHAKGRTRLLLRKHHIDYDSLGEHTIVFVHGFMQGAGFSLSHKKYAKKEGENNIVSFIYKNSLQDIRTTAMELEDFIKERLMKRSPAKEFTLVGHSQGGLVCRYLVERRTELEIDHPTIKRVVTLGTPFQGTKYIKHIRPLVSLFDHKGLEQMRNEPETSNFLKELNKEPLSVPYVSIYTVFDEIVEPADSSFLKGATNIKLGEGKYSHIKVGHAGLLDNYEVYKIIKDAVEGKI